MISCFPTVHLDGSQGELGYRYLDGSHGELGLGKFSVQRVIGMQRYFYIKIAVN